MSWREAEAGYTDEVVGETTLPVMFFDAVERYPDTTCQRYKGGAYHRTLPVDEPPADEYAGLDYAEVADVVRNLAAGFRDLGVEAGDRVGIYADTRMEWAQSDMALLSAGAVVTTVYTESSAQQVEYLLDDPGATGVVVENEELLETVLAVSDDLALEFVVSIDDPGEYSDHEDVFALGEVHDRGAETYDEDAFQSWLDDRDLDDLATLIYTSGTTGQPKGVKLTHRNFRSSVNNVRKRVGPRPDKGPDVPTLEHGKTALSFLPLAHAFERFNHFVQLGSGITIAYAESTDTIAEDIQRVAPESAASVPRVYERIFDGMRAEASESAVGKRLFEWAVDFAGDYDDADDPGLLMEAKYAIADRLVYSQVREALGGNVELFISGGGSLSEDLAKLYRTMGLTILEGYGMTESAPVITLNPPEDIRVGTMGPVLPGVEAILDESIAAPEQSESAPGDVGELLVKGDNVTDGYWNKPEATAESFTEDGWFRTGDVVAVDDDGYFRFVDRVKQLIVLDTGKNVAPERVEDEFATSSRVDQIMVLGDDRKFVAAVVVPNFDELRDWAEATDVALPDDPADVCEDDRVVEWVGEEIDRVNERLGHHEEIKEFRVVPEEWTPDNDLLTPSMKKKRRNIVARYDEEIADIYDEERATVEP